MSASFRPTLLLGISLLDNEAFAGAGVFFNLPTVSATVSQVAHVNSKCEPITGNGTTSNSVLDDVFGSLTHIEENVEFDFGLVAEASLGVGGVDDVYTVFNTSFPLPTACLSFDSDKSTLGPVTASGSGTQSGAGASGTAQGAAAAGAVNPLGQLLKATGRIEIVLGALLLVSVCFGGL